MSFHGYDDKPKNREAEEALIAEFISNGGNVNKMPNSKKAEKLRRANIALKKKDEENGFEELFDLADF